MARPNNCGKCNKPKRPKGKRFKDLEGYCECGRPTVMTDKTLRKLRDAYTIGLNDVKACAYAGIGVSTLHDYQARNPEFPEEKERLRLKPDLKAQQTIVSRLGDPQHAWRWLEKKDPSFMPKSKLELAGSVEVADLTTDMTKEEKDALEIIRKARRKRIEDESRKLKM